MSNHWPRGETNPLDDAIDRAVRTMMNVDPPAGLRRRVLSRLETSPGPVPWLPRLALGMAVLAALVVAVLLLRPAPAPTELVQQAAGRQAAPAPPVATADESQKAKPTVAAPPSARTAVTETPIPMPRVADVFGARNAAVTAANADVEEVVFADPGGAEGELPGAPPEIVVPQIVVAPLQLERIGSDRMPPRK